jgi:hypothetical protein
MSYAFGIMRLQRMAAVIPQTSVFQSRRGVNQPIGTIQAWKILREAAITNDLTGKLGTHMIQLTRPRLVLQQVQNLREVHLVPLFQPC